MSSATATATATNDVHILVFPYPAQGHMLALLDLTNQLALKGLKITILVTPKNLHALNSLLSAHPNSIQTLVLPFPPHPKLPLGVENVKDVGNSGNAPIIASLSKLEGEVIQWFQSHPSPPKVILSDFFLGYTHHWAQKLNIPRIGFFSTRAFLSSLLTHLYLYQDFDNLSTLQVVEFPDMPRSPSFVADHLPSIFRKYSKGEPDWEIVREGILANSKSWGYVFNSFYALEGDYLDHVKKELGHGRVYSVGPVRPTGGSESSRRTSPDSDTRSNVINWLDKWSDGSVLYVCFGSQKLLTRAQMEALALGLEQSKTPFVWVVKSESSTQAEIDQFERRVANQGLVVRGWAPQTEILNHRAVGGFLSHCGWNSLLESLVAGVMILAWPMEADQYVNAKLLVDDMEMAVPLCEGEHTVPDPDKLALIISNSLSGNIPQKERAKVMKEKAFEAVEDGGSSSMDLDELVKELSQMGVQKS